MMSRITWIALGSVAAALPTCALTYLSVEQAQQAIFPGAKLIEHPLKLTREQREAIEKASGTKVRASPLRVWQVEGGGWFILDEVIGKHEFITFAVGLEPDGAVKQIEVLDYRENYGSEVRRPEWRQQFVGRKPGASLQFNRDIKNISGATLSCRHLTEGVSRLLATYDLVLRH